MGTNYGLHCMTCRVVSGAGTKQTDFLAELVRLAPEIHALLEKDSHGMIQVTGALGYSFYYVDDPDEDTIYDWVGRHAGHEILLCDEYGRDSPLPVMG